MNLSTLIEISEHKYKCYHQNNKIIRKSEYEYKNVNESEYQCININFWISVPIRAPKYQYLMIDNTKQLLNEALCVAPPTGLIGSVLD